jgi:hypothetical protein
LGIEGVILGTLVAQALVWPVLLRFFLQRFDVALPEWFRRVVLPNLPGLAVQAATAFPLLWLAERAGNLAEVGALVLVSVGVSLGAFVLLGLSRDQRTLLIATLRRAGGLDGAAA